MRTLEDTTSIANTSAASLFPEAPRAQIPQHTKFEDLKGTQTLPDIGEGCENRSL